VKIILRSSLLSLLWVQMALGQNYWGAEYRTIESYQYGRFETSMQPAQGEGFLCSFFTYNDSNPATDWAEIDFEVLGRWPDNVDINVIDENGSHLRQHPVDLNLQQGFHSYAMEWTPDYVAWFLDGEEFFRQAEEHIDHLSQPSKIMMNIWTPLYTDWVGFIDDRTLPRYGLYDWASYAAYTPGSGSVGTDGNFSPLWTDSFDSFDSTRWEKSDDHNWPGNNATMKTQNVEFEDGKLVLCLTLPNLGGIQEDTAPPVALWARAHGTDSVTVRFSERLDPVSASTTTTYVIPGQTIGSATLNDDEVTVGLKLAGELGNPTSVYALALRDQAIPPNLQMGTQATIAMADPLTLPIRIDVAGPGRQGFLPDQWWSPQVEYGHEGGNYQEAGAFPDLSNTDLDSVMATSLNRYSRYHVRLQPGIFDIQLHFAEYYYTGAAERTFELYIEDSLWVPELDVYAQAGNGEVYTLQINDLVINDGLLDILGAAIQYGETYAYAGPVLNAIEIEGEYFLGVQNDQLPQGFGLNTIYPNPFNSSAHINFTLPASELVTVSAYSIKGSKIMELTHQQYAAGTHELTLDATGLSSGLYIVKLTSNSFRQSRKILYLK